MPTSIRRRGLLLLALLPGVCAAQKPSNASPYRLQLPERGDYRLHNASYASGAIAATPAMLEKKPYAREIEAAARASRLDPVLVHALIHVESRHRKDAVSNKGAIGLMQLMPATAQRFGVDKPEQVSANLRAGTRYLRMLLDLYDQRLDLALSAYNAGEGAVARYGGIPPYAETRRYVPAVMETFSAWRGRESHLRQLADSTPLENDTPGRTHMLR